MPALTTTQEIDAARHRYRTGKIPADTLKVMDAATSQLAASGAVNNALTVGDLAPDFILPDVHGGTVRLYTALERGPVVLVFYRGGWCPYCNLHLRGFQRLLPEFEASGAQLIAISPQLPDASLTTREKAELTFPVLSDVGLHTARALGIAFELPASLLEVYARAGHVLATVNGESGATALPMPATFVVRPDHVIAFAHVDADYSRRAEPLEVLQRVQALNPALAPT